MTIKLDFLRELNEARMFRWEETLKGKTMSQISHVVYYTFLALEIMRYEDRKFAASYASRTIKYNKFQSMMPGATDLHNLLSVCSHPEDYNDYLKVDINVSVPFYAVRRNCLDIMSGNSYLSRSRSFFIALEGDLKVNSSAARRLRREVVDWSRSGPADKEHAIRGIYQFLREKGLYTDIFRQFKDSIYNNLKVIKK